MAEPLSSLRPATGNLTAGTFLEFYDKYDEVERDIQDAQEAVRAHRKRRKDLRKSIEAAGINLTEFDRTRQDAGLPDEVREANDRSRRQYLAWLKKPVGYQGDLDLTGDEQAFSVHELKAVDNDGYEAGRASHRRDSNPHKPGSEAHVRWDNAYQRGAEWMAEQRRIADSMAPPASVNGSGNGAEQPQRRGRGPDRQPRKRRGSGATVATA